MRNFSIGYLEGGLKDRAITRDIEWGIPLPLDGYDGKRIYVWFEAVIGYLSASKEWAARNGEPERWRSFWQEEECRAYYFMGKDNIPFHTIIWPAMLTGYGGLNLPYDVPANEYLNLEGLKLSTSRDWAVWLPDYLDRYEPDPLRYVLAANMPGDERLRLLVARVRPGQQRRAGRHVREPGAPGADDVAPELRRTGA